MANVRLISYILITLFFHILFIKLHPVNLEELFIYAAENLTFKTNLDFYFQYQANTLLYSTILHYISKPFHFIDLNILSKLLSCSGYILLGCGVYQLKKSSYLDSKYDLIFLLIVINPLIWTFGYRGTPDFISLAIGFYGFCLSLDKKKLLEKFGYFLLGLSIALKPHSIIFLIFLFFYKNNFSKNIIHNVKENYSRALILLIIPIIFFSGNYIKYDFLILNDILQNNHKLNLKNIIPNLISYFGILTIFCFPFFFHLFLRDIINKNYLILKYGIIYIVILIPFSFILNFNGEIFLGFFSTLINKKIYLILLIISSFLSIFYLIRFVKNNQEQDRLLAIASLIFIFLMSLSRPSDRYVIFLIPFIIILFRHELQSKILITFCTIFNLLIAGIIFSNYYINSTLTKNIKKILIKKNLQYDTDLGNLFVHAPVFKNKYGKSNNYKFKLYLYKKDKTVHDECAQVLFFKKCYSVIKIKDE